jgi:hypothetical protein
MKNSITYEVQEIDNRLVFWKTRIVELSVILVRRMQTGNEKAHETEMRLSLLHDLKKGLNDYRFQQIFLTQSQLDKMIKMGNELASIY